MNKFVAIANIDAVIAEQVVLPTITLWNRLEGRPRTHNFDRALKAEIRDALWMLTKQWQMGEFQGDDAGSPIKAKLHLTTTQLTKYRADGHGAQVFEADVPLEAKVEQRAMPFEAEGKPLSLDIRLLMGRRWLKLAGGIEPGLRDKFIERFGIAQPDPANKDDADICASLETWQQFSALSGRAMDGWELYHHLKSAPANHAHDGIALTNAASKAAIEAFEVPFIEWYESLFYQPLDPENDAWDPSRLEYAFACSAPKEAQEMVLSADEYYHGHLDWYNFDIDGETGFLPDPEEGTIPTGVEGKETSSFIPVPISFDGMPNTRWWTFEDGRTNFGDIAPDTPDINKLLLIEFGLVYANDWFLLPVTVPAGAIISVKGLAVTNVFGERTWIEASGRGTDDNWQRWTMFALSTKGSAEVPADVSLLILPTVPKIQQSEPIEAAQLVRDEIANMVWAVETTVPMPSGDGGPGRTVALEKRAFLEGLAPPPAPPAGLPENDAAIRYELMRSVPENWIPFIPVHIKDDNREVQLRRAAMPRLIEGLPVERVRPRTTLIRHGLDSTPPQSLIIHEEEVPRAGVNVSQSFQRVRWYDGQTFVWLGAGKQIGRGERSSGLAFDQIRSKLQQS